LLLPYDSEALSPHRRVSGGLLAAFNCPRVGRDESARFAASAADQRAHEAHRRMSPGIATSAATLTAYTVRLT
jgi:hypothetical protein